MQYKKTPSTTALQISSQHMQFIQICSIFSQNRYETLSLKELKINLYVGFVYSVQISHCSNRSAEKD